MLKRGGVVWILLCFLTSCSGGDDPPSTASSSQPTQDAPAQQPSPSPTPAPSTSPATSPENPPPSTPPAPTPTITPAGPWPVMDLAIYSSSQGLIGEVIDAGPDDAQNMWVATPDSLYVLQPGRTAFRRLTAADGLHVQTFTDEFGRQTVSSITALAGGRANEVFVGYRGYEEEIPPPAPPRCCVPNADFSDPRWAMGQGDKVTMNPDGTIQIRRYLFLCDNNANCWEERSVRRMIFGHSGTAAGHLFVGFDHGITHVFNDTFGDHTHVQTIWHYPDGRNVQRMGEQYGLALFPNGNVLTAGAYGVGMQPWNPDPKAWVDGSFVWAFTTSGPAESYNTGPHSLVVPSGYREDNRGAAVSPDGTAWWVGLLTGLSSYNHTVARGNHSFIRTWNQVPGLPTSGLIDIAADPDGTLWIVDNSGRLLRFNPTTATVQVWPGVSSVRRIVMDTTVIPRALYVSMGTNGLAVIRAN